MVPNLVRLSHSMNRDDLDKKYALDKLAKVDSFNNKARDSSPEAQHQENLRRSDVLDNQCNILVAPITSLLSSGTGKTLLDKYFQLKLFDSQNQDRFGEQGNFA